MNEARTNGWERWAYASAWVLMLAPVLAHALARPLLVALTLDAQAPRLTLASLLVALTVTLGRRWRAPAQVWAMAAVAVVLGTVLVDGARGWLAAGVPLLAVALASMLALPRMIDRLPARLDGLARAHRGVAVGVAVAMLIGTVETAMLATFIGDPSWTQGAFPLVPDLAHHACSTAYMRAGELAVERVENLYAAEYWPSLAEPGSAVVAAAQRCAPFDLDAYAYPPPFLLLVRPFVALADFSAQRAAWFGLNTLWLALGLWTVAAWIGEQDEVAGTRVALASAVLWSSPVVIVTLQTGNVHPAMLATVAMAMVAFERERPALGGALLAVAILSKISPGLLGVVLLVRRQFRAALWSAGWGVILAVLTWLSFGLEPFVAFVSYELPRLSSGEALAFFATNLRDTTLNIAPFGVPFKLEALGVDIDDPWARAHTISSVFNLVVIAAAIVAGLRDGPSWARAGVWMALMTLGGLRSPFAPGYVAISLMWALCLLLPELRGRRGLALIGLGVLASFGVPPMPASAGLIVSLVQQMLVAGLAIYLIARAGLLQPRRSDTPGAHAQVGEAPLVGADVQAPVGVERAEV